MTEKQVVDMLDSISLANLNTVGMCAEYIATKRNKVNDTTNDTGIYHALDDELDEIYEVLNEDANLAPSQHIGDEYTWLEEEIADALIVCLTWLSWKGVNIPHLVRKKMMYNLNRKD